MILVRNLGREVLLFFIGGMSYFCLELIWRGWSHPAMVLVGGVCFLGVGRIGEGLNRRIPLALRAMLGALIITAVEFVSGCILNLWLGLDLWDYSRKIGNVLGQICPAYMALWYLLAFPVILTDDYMRWRICGEEPPRYCLVWAAAGSLGWERPNP